MLPKVAVKNEVNININVFHILQAVLKEIIGNWYILSFGLDSISVSLG